MPLSHPIEKWRYFLLLTTLLLALAGEPLVFGRSGSALLFDALYSFILIAAVYALAVRRHRKRVVIALATLAMLSTWISYAFSGKSQSGILIGYHVAGIAFMAYVTCAAVYNIIRSHKFTLDSIFGSVAGYLLLGTCWGMVYSFLHIFSPEAFSLSDELLPYMDERGTRLPVFIYYSFSTLTTLGFGDLTPITPAARTLTWLEAVSGQFYLAVLVAGIIGVLVTHGFEDLARLGHRPTADDDGPGEGS